MEYYEYDVFGEPTIWDVGTMEIISSSGVGNPYMFTARRYDGEFGIGLYYYRARFYRPHIGRFLQTDPIGYYYSMNLYEYCLNDPINWVDPWGEARIRSRPLKSRTARRFARHIVGDNIHSRHWQIFYDDGDNSGYFGDDKNGAPYFGRDKNTSGYDRDVSKHHYDDDTMRKAEKNVQNKWRREGRRYHPIDNNCQDYVLEVLDEYRRISEQGQGNQGQGNQGQGGKSEKEVSS